MADFGYDVSNYVDIDPIFGSMDDFDRLVVKAHALGIRGILDFVPNHSSDRHPWFIDSRRSRSNPKRDWYIWRDPAPDGGPPNNWLSEFGGRAWEFD
jgi:alpha-glucosidase